MRLNVRKHLKGFYEFYKIAFAVFFVIAFAQSWACHVFPRKSMTALGMGLIYSLLTGAVAGVTWPLSVSIAIVYIFYALISL